MIQGTKCSACPTQAASSTVCIGGESEAPIATEHPAPPQANLRPPPPRLTPFYPPNHITTFSADPYLTFCSIVKPAAL